MGQCPGNMVSHLARNPHGRYMPVSKRSTGPSVFDPFCGAGSVIVSVAQRGFAVSGLDLRPFAALLTKVELGGFDPIVAGVLATRSVAGAAPCRAECRDRRFGVSDRTQAGSVGPRDASPPSGARQDRALCCAGALSWEALRIGHIPVQAATCRGRADTPCALASRQLVLRCRTALDDHRVLQVSGTPLSVTCRSRQVLGGGTLQPARQDLARGQEPLLALRARPQDQQFEPRPSAVHSVWCGAAAAVHHPLQKTLACSLSRIHRAMLVYGPTAPVAQFARGPIRMNHSASARPVPATRIASTVIARLRSSAKPRLQPSRTLSARNTRRERRTPGRPPRAHPSSPT